MLTAAGPLLLLASIAFSGGIRDRRFRSQPWRRLRTKTCPLFGVERAADRGRSLAVIGFHAFSRGIKNRGFRSQPWPKVRTKTCPLFDGNRVWHDGQCPRNRMNFSRALLHQTAQSVSMTGCLSGPREPNE